MNPLGFDMPMGADTDPRGPYNQTTAESCTNCEGEGIVTCLACRGQGPCKICEDGLVSCEVCDGVGAIYPPTREEIEEAKADIAMDREKDGDL